MTRINFSSIKITGILKLNLLNLAYIQAVHNIELLLLNGPDTMVIRSTVAFQPGLR